MGDAATGERPKFVFEPTFGERAEVVNAFYNAFTGRERSLAAYRWEFFDNPAGPGLAWVIADAASGEIVGHHGIIPTPLVVGGESVAAGRTENTMVRPDVRTKIFYAGMERKALRTALERFRILHTPHPVGPGPIRRRFGYVPIGRWTIFLPRIGAGYLFGLLHTARDKLAPRLPDAALRLAAGSVGAVAWGLRGFRGWLGWLGWRHGGPLRVEEIGALEDLGAEYEQMWERARSGYDVTIDRRLPYMRWRCSDNPHLRYRIWTLRRDGRLLGVVIGHAHRLAGGAALFVDDIIAADYDQATFAAIVRSLDRLAPEADSVVVRTLDVPTPLRRALARRFPLQALLSRRLAPRLFPEMLVLDPDGRTAWRRWYATPLVTQGMDTSR